MNTTTPSPLAQSLNDLPAEAHALLLRMLDADQPGVAGSDDDPAVRALLDDQIVEPAKAGISEFPYRLPHDTWRRLRELRPLIEQIAAEGPLNPTVLVRIEVGIDARLAAERDEGGVLGWIIGIAVFVLRPIGMAPWLMRRAWGRHQNRQFIDEGVPMAHELEREQTGRPSVTPQRGPRDRL